MRIIFCDYGPAPSPRRARMILAEKEIDHEVFHIDMRKQEQLSDAYRSVNPACTLPALQFEDGRVLTENWGIACWAEAFAPDPALMGVTALDKGEVASWASKIDFGFTIAFAEAYRNSHKVMAGRALPGPRDFEQIPELAERGFARIADFIDHLDSHLEGRDYIAADQFSIADIWALTTLDVTRWIKAGPGEEHEALNAWHQRVSTRESAQL